MRFFTATLLLAAALVRADKGDPIGYFHSDDACQSEDYVTLIDGDCTFINETSINFTAKHSVCFLYTDDGCAQESETKDGIVEGCQTVEALAGDAMSVICFGQNQ
ncbi:hypothetical protein MauCBS54593_007140 [Microsporum audouinii]